MIDNQHRARKWLAAATTFGAAALVFGAAALAQTPTPGVTVTQAETSTAGSTAMITETLTPMASETSIMTGTATVTSTMVATNTREVPTVSVPSAVYEPGGTGDFPFADSAFRRVWDRTDSLVAEGRIARTWFWGPGPNTPGLLEQYNQGADSQRLVQYFDKSRMEINNPQGDRSQSFFVTNGLLTVELISGYIQVGDNDFVKYRPACIPMSGDFGDTTAPTYYAFQGVSNTQAGDHDAPDRTGQSATDTIDRVGNVGNDPSKANVPGVKLVHFEPATQHNIPQVFWDFLNSSGPVKNDQGQIVTEQLINPWNYASGYPISEPYWAKATIQGQLTDVMIQAYERRALTYVPSNQAGFQVEMANIGQHYFDWRYRNYGYCPADVITTPTPPMPAPTGTALPSTPGATGTPETTETVEATGTPETATATPTSANELTPPPTETEVNMETATATATEVNMEPPTATATATEVNMEPPTATDTPNPVATQLVR